MISEYRTEYDLIVDPELEAYLPGPPVHTDEQLKASLLKHGRALDAVKVWVLPEGQCVVDGHRRYKFCKELNLPYRTEEVPFTSKAEAKHWMDVWYMAQRHPDSHHATMTLARIAQFHSAQELLDTVSNNTPDTPEAPVEPKRKDGRRKNRGTKKAAKESGKCERTVRRALAYQDAFNAILPEIQKKILDRSMRVAMEDVVQLGALPHNQQRLIYEEFQETRDRTIGNVLHGYEEDAPVSGDLTPEELKALKAGMPKPERASKAKGEAPTKCPFGKIKEHLRQALLASGEIESRNVFTGYQEFLNTLEKANRMVDVWKKIGV